MKISKSKNGTNMESFELKEISLSDRDLYFDYMKISEFPTDVFSWYFPYLWSSSQSSIRKICWSMFDDMLVTFAHTRRDILYLWCLPFGPGGSEKVIEVLYQSLIYCTEWNKEKGFKPMVRTINNPQLEYLQKSSNFSKLFYTKQLNGIERLHSMKNLLTLPGRDFGKVRNKMRKFHKNQPEAFIRKYEQKDYNALLELQTYWNNTAGKKYKRIFDSVRYSETIKHFQELHHLILLMQYQNKIIGMISGGLVPSGQSFCYFIKTMEIDGLSEVLLVELAREINRQYPQTELLNVGSDLGCTGLITFKEKFKPVRNLQRYELYQS